MVRTSVNTIDPSSIVCPPDGTYTLRFVGIGTDPVTGEEECAMEDYQGDGEFKMKCKYYFVIDEPGNEWHGYGTGEGYDGEKEPKLFQKIVTEKFNSDRSNLYKFFMAISGGEFPGPIVTRPSGWKEPANMPVPTTDESGTYFDTSAIIRGFVGKKLRAFVRRSERGWPNIDSASFAPATENGATSRRGRAAPAITAIPAPEPEPIEAEFVDANDDDADNTF
jgi:hypothetical protein